MKYFMTVWSHARNCERHFEMSLDKAKYYYQSWIEQKDLLDCTRKEKDTIIAEAMKNGSVIVAPRTAPSHMRIWGEEMSNAELFRRRICGDIDKEKLDEF